MPRLCLRLQLVAGQCDPIVDKCALGLQVVEPAADQIDLAVRRHGFADVRALPQRDKLRLVFPQIKHPVACITFRLFGDIGDHLNDRFAVHVAQTEEITPDELGLYRMEYIDTVRCVDKDVVVVRKPFRARHFEVLKGEFAFLLDQRRGIFDKGYEALGLFVAVAPQTLALIGASDAWKQHQGCDQKPAQVMHV